MLNRSNIPVRAGLVFLSLLLTNAPALAQCTVGEIIQQMAASTEALELVPIEGTETLAPPDQITEDETSEFVFTPEIRADQRRLLRRVGRACAWTSDVPDCTFRRVARMALRGRDAAFIYDQCSD